MSEDIVSILFNLGFFPDANIIYKTLFYIFRMKHKSKFFVKITKLISRPENECRT